MFCHITQNWRGRAPESLEAVVNLVGSTTTVAGLCIRANLDAGRYEKGTVVTDDEKAPSLSSLLAAGASGATIAPGGPRSDRYCPASPKDATVQERRQIPG